MTTLLFVGGLGPPEMLLIAGVLVLLFGASKLPKLARSMGTATGEFKKGRQEVEGELEELREGGVSDPSEPDGVRAAETETEAASASDSSTDTDLETDADADADSDTDTDRERDSDQSGA
jgi:sec-independent protein translocase protein TatA